MKKNKSAIFTEHDFVVLLLSSLQRNGTCEISEESLSEKLYYYFINPLYKELFEDITLNELSKQININNGIQKEQSNNNIISDNLDTFSLKYNEKDDFWNAQKNISKEGLSLLKKIALELSIRKKIENQSKCKINIYGAYSNTSYMLVKGLFHGKVVGWNLLTDGDAKDIKYLSEKRFRNCYFDSPLSKNETVKFEDAKIITTNIENSSFVIMQGICNEMISYANIFTNLIDEHSLLEIMEYANTYYNLDSKSHIKKLTLK